MPKPANHGLVVLAVAVPVQFHEPTISEGFNVVEGVRPVRVPGNLNPLPRGQVGIDLLADGLDFLFEVGDSTLHVDLSLPIDVLGLFELFAQLADGLFEIEVVHLDVSSV